MPCIILLSHPNLNRFCPYLVISKSMILYDFTNCVWEDWLNFRRRQLLYKHVRSMSLTLQCMQIRFKNKTRLNLALRCVNTCPNTTIDFVLCIASSHPVAKKVHWELYRYYLSLTRHNANQCLVSILWTSFNFTKATVYLPLHDIVQATTHCLFHLCCMLWVLDQPMSWSWLLGPWRPED